MKKEKVILNSKTAVCYAVFKEHWVDDRWVKNGKYRLCIDFVLMENGEGVEVIEIDRYNRISNDFRGRPKSAEYQTVEDVALDWDIISYVGDVTVPGLKLTREYSIDLLIDRLKSEVI